MTSLKPPSSLPVVSAPRDFNFLWKSSFQLPTAIAARLSLSFSHKACGQHEAKASRTCRHPYGEFLHQAIVLPHLTRVYFFPFVWRLAVNFLSFLYATESVESHRWFFSSFSFCPLLSARVIQWFKLASCAARVFMALCIVCYQRRYFHFLKTFLLALCEFHIMYSLIPLPNLYPLSTPVTFTPPTQKNKSHCGSCNVSHFVHTLLARTHCNGSLIWSKASGFCYSYQFWNLTGTPLG